MSSNALRAVAALLIVGVLSASGASAQGTLVGPPPECPSGNHLRTLHFIIATADDDLRGGSDNVDLYARTVGSPDWRRVPIRGGLNHGARWADWSTHTVDVTVGEGSCPPPPAFITGLRLQTTSGGGTGGDNWNLLSLSVEWIGTDATGKRASGLLANVPAVGRRGHRHRFTAYDNAFEIPLLPH